MMRKVSITLAAMVLLFVALPLAPAGATPPISVHFEVENDFVVGGPFYASGDAVDDGLICSVGYVTDRQATATGWQSNRGVNFHVYKEFDCDDGSGSFFVQLQARADFKGDNFQWTIKGGTGDYERLHGSGDGIGLPFCGEGCVFDVYDGKVHVD